MTYIYGQGSLWVTGHDADFHCAYSSLQCHYVRVALDIVRDGSTLPVLALDHGNMIAQAVARAYPTAAPTVASVDPRAEFASIPFVDGMGSRCLVQSWLPPMSHAVGATITSGVDP